MRATRQTAPLTALAATAILLAGCQTTSDSGGVTRSQEDSAAGTSTATGGVAAPGVPTDDELLELQDALRAGDEDVVAALAGPQADDATKAQLAASLAGLTIDADSMTPLAEGRASVEATTDDGPVTLRLVRGAEGWIVESLLHAQR